MKKKKNKRNKLSYLNGEATVGYIFTAKLNIDIIIARIIQSIEYIKEAILFDNIDIH